MPIHDPDTFVAVRSDLRGDGIQRITEGYKSPTFVRAVDILLRDLTYAPNSAAELLEATDRELEKVAKLCGAQVVGHEWGLYPVNGKDNRYRNYIPGNQGFGGIVTLPRNHILVAEVNVIKPIAPSAESGMTLEEAIQDFREAIASGVPAYYEAGKGTYQLFDMRHEPARSGKSGPKLAQFEWGVPVGSPNDEPDRHVVDIDPRFSLTR